MVADAGILLNADPEAISDDDAHLLSKHYDFYRALDSGDRPPTTPAQKHFVSVCRGTVLPKTDHERAYARFHRFAVATVSRETMDRLRMEIDAVIATRNPKEQVVAHEYYFRGASISAIADLMGWSEGSIWKVINVGIEPKIMLAVKAISERPEAAIILESTT